MTVQPPEQPIPREPDVTIPPCVHPVRDSDTGCCVVSRCACGAIRVGARGWMDRNSRRRDERRTRRRKEPTR